MSEKTSKILRNDFVSFMMNTIKDPDIDCKLVGGAVIDILEGREPKDYDLIDHYGVDRILLGNKFKIKSRTKYADTYDNGSWIVQLLKTKPKDFDFTISQSSFMFTRRRLNIDEYAFDNKALLPVSFEAENAANSLARLPKWYSKGYKIDITTYLSLVSVATNVKIVNFNS